MFKLPYCMLFQNEDVVKSYIYSEYVDTVSKPCGKYHYIHSKNISANSNIIYLLYVHFFIHIDVFSYHPNGGITNRSFTAHWVPIYKEGRSVVYNQVSNVCYFPPHPALIQAAIMRAVGGTYTADSVS